MEIIEYDEKYLEDVKDLLVELEEYIISIDEDDLDQIHPEYREKMAKLNLDEVAKNEGKCYLAIDDGKAVGLIMGVVRSYDENDYLDYMCPRGGAITELIVSKKARTSGVGTSLIAKMEAYFKSIGCEYIYIDVFAYNKNALQFYRNKGYHSRMEIMLKKIG